MGSEQKIAPTNRHLQIVKFQDLLHAHANNEYSKISYCDECDQLYDCPDALAWTNLSARKAGVSHTAVFDEQPVIFKNS